MNSSFLEGFVFLGENGVIEPHLFFILI